MKLILTLVFTGLIFQLSFGQVATIQDKDGWTNIRKEPNGQSKIIHKVFENEVFWFTYPSRNKDQNWISVYLPKDSFCLDTNGPRYIIGFIHKSRLFPLEKMKEFSGSGFSFNYLTSVFDSTNRTVDRYGKWVHRIDGKPVWGADGGFPRIQVDNIEVKIDGEVINLHSRFYQDIYECDNDFRIYKNGDTYFVHQWNSDGAGAYEIVWVLNKEGLKQRLVGTII